MIAEAFKLLFRVWSEEEEEEEEHRFASVGAVVVVVVAAAGGALKVAAVGRYVGRAVAAQCESFDDEIEEM